MKAGFAKACITPPIGTRMSGYGARDKTRGAEAVNDDLFVRVAYLENNGERALIAGFDLLFFAREHADRLKGALGRAADLLPRQILLNTSHTHSGPTVDRWAYAACLAPNYSYMNAVEAALLQAAREAMAKAVNATAQAGMTETRLPVSRRRPDGRGGVEWRPYPEGTVCSAVPFCRFVAASGETAALLFSVSCHPSTINNWSISADYPGVACNILDRALGNACSIFLQGAGGDTKARVIADGRDDVGPAWRQGTVEDVRKAGEIAVENLLEALAQPLKPSAPALASAIVEMKWPLEPAPDHNAIMEMTRSENQFARQAAQLQIEHMDLWGHLPDSAQILAHGIQLAEGVRIIAIEGELVGEMGLTIMSAFPDGTTFPLGYSNGTGLYLPNSRMLQEGGYESESVWEYGYAARLKPGTESRLLEGIAALRAKGIS